MNAIKRVVGKFILGIGMCVFAGSAMALDLGGMMQQLDQAAKQMDHQAAQQQSSAPSFNCAKASTATEQLICSNSDLSALDVKLAQLYQQVMSKSDDVNSLKKSQNEWRKTKRDACSNVSCLASTYNERVNELSQILSNPSVPTQLSGNSTDAVQKQAIQQQALQQPIQQQPTTTIPQPGVALADMKFSDEPTTVQPQSTHPEAGSSNLVADEAAKEVLKAEIAADLARIAANEKADAAKAANAPKISAEQNDKEQNTNKKLSAENTRFLVYLIGGALYLIIATIIAWRFVRPAMMDWYKSQTFFFVGQNAVDIMSKQIQSRLGFELITIFISAVVGIFGGAIIYLILKFINREKTTPKESDDAEALFTKGMSLRKKVIMEMHTTASEKQP